jgi:hypothetical protein
VSLADAAFPYAERIAFEPMTSPASVAQVTAVTSLPEFQIGSIADSCSVNLPHECRCARQRRRTTGRQAQTQPN